MTEPVLHTITNAAWTLVAFNSSQAIIISNPLLRLRAHIGSTPPPLDTSQFFTITGTQAINNIRPFDGLYLRADAAPEIEITVYSGNALTGVMFFGKSPFRISAPGQTSISTPYEPQILDGGTPETDYAGLAIIDCGDPATNTTVRTIDGRINGEIP